jgi:uridine kinase
MQIEPNDPLETIARAILALRRPHPPRVLIDGRSAAGTTTFSAALAARLAQARPVVLAHFDDFHPLGYAAGGGSAPYTPAEYLERGFDFAAFERLVMAPAAPGGSGETALALADPSRTVKLAADGILLVDGCFLAKPGWRERWDFVVWLDVSFETMIERAAGRDVAWVGDAAKVRRRYAGFWRETHSLYERWGPRETADAIVDNEDAARPRLVSLTQPSGPRRRPPAS